MYIADGDYIKDIEINDLRNRYTLTKGSTQKMVNTLSCPLIIPGASLESLPCDGAGVLATIAQYVCMLCV